MNKKINKQTKKESKISIQKIIKNIFTKKCINFFALSSFLSSIQVFCYIVIVLLLPYINAAALSNNKDQWLFPNFSAEMQIAILVPMLIVISIISFLLGLISNHYSVKFAKETSINIRNLVYSKIQTFSMADIESFSQSSLLNRLTIDVTMIATACESFSRLLIKSLLLYFGGLIGMILLVIPSNNTNTITPTSGGVQIYWIVLIIVIISLLLIGIIVIISMFAYKWFNLGQKKLDNINNLMQENVLGQRTIKSFNLHEYQFQKFDKANEELRKTTTRSGFIMSAVLPSVYFFLDISLVLTTWLSNKAIIDKLMSLYMLMSLMIIALVLTIVGIIQINRSIPCFKRSLEVLNYKQLITFVDKDEKTIGKRNIKLSNVSFKYPNSTKYSLKNINLEIEPNQVVGIIGSTGSGKTTLMHLLTRMYDVTNGNIEICENEIKKLTKHSLKSLISFCPQSVVLFAGTIKSNLLFGNPKATQNDMEDVCKISNLWEFIEKQKDKFDIEITQRANNLSGGQKQRLAIARALIKDSPLLLLDDATSALDMITEKEICNELLKNKKNQTILISSQRINAIRNANKIIVMENGKVLAEGTHFELLKKCQYYYDVAVIQLGQKEVDNEINQK